MVDETRIGVYRIERRLGKGGMGEVLLAFDDRLGRPVAIKRIRGGRSSGARRRRARQLREARALARLNHPAIAQVHDVVDDGAGYAIVMQYVEGRTLAQLLEAGEIDGGLAINVAIQVAQGLAAAHNLGMVHRDLKAENVMVTPAGYAKILDFGLVKKISREDTRETLTAKGQLLGTVGWMSPEQASGREVDARSDLFSFGILLYEIFTGYSPFHREHWLDSLEAIKSARQTPAHVVRPELPVELSQLIEWLLQKDPQARPQSTYRVVDRLARLAATTQVGTLPPPRLPGAPPRAAGQVTSTVTVRPSSAGLAGWLRRLEASCRRTWRFVLSRLLG